MKVVGGLTGGMVIEVKGGCEDMHWLLWCAVLVKTGLEERRVEEKGKRRPTMVWSENP